LKRLLTWRLWRSINNPPEWDPVYHHVLNAHSESLWTMFLHSRITRFGAIIIWSVALPILLLADPLGLLSFTLPIFWVVFSLRFGEAFLGVFGIIILAILVLAILALMFSPALYVVAFQLYAAFLAGRISSEITATRENRMHDLLCITPGGAPGVYRAYSNASVHRGKAFGRFMTAGYVLLAFGGLAVLQAIGEISTNTQSILPLIIVVVATFIFYVDLRQTIVMSVLVGMLTPLYTIDRANSRFGAVGVFLGLQMAIYVIIILVNVVMLPLLYTALNLSGLIPELILGLLWVGTYVAVREFAGVILWRRLSARLEDGVTGNVWSWLRRMVVKR